MKCNTVFYLPQTSDLKRTYKKHCAKLTFCLVEGHSASVQTDHYNNSLPSSCSMEEKGKEKKYNQNNKQICHCQAMSPLFLFLCLSAHSPRIYFPPLRSGHVSSSCHRELEFVCLPPQTITFVQTPVFHLI